MPEENEIFITGDLKEKNIQKGGFVPPSLPRIKNIEEGFVPPKLPQLPPKGKDEKK